MTDPLDKYNEILEKPETPEYNDIDRAKELLETLLDDPEQLIGSDAGAIIDRTIGLLT